MERIEKEKNFISAVIYVRDNENEIFDFLTSIYDILNENFDKFEIILVNDDSGDLSVEKIKAFAGKFASSSATLLNMSYFHGLELSMNAGVDLAIGDFVFEFDSSDADYDPSFIMDVYYASLKGNDIVSASPKNKERRSSRFFYRLLNKLLPFGGHMKSETFRILSRRAINRINQIHKTIPYRKIIYQNSGLNSLVLEYAPLTSVLRKKKDKRYETYRKDLAVNAILLFTDFGYRFALAMTFIMMTIALLIGGYALVVFIFADPAAGWTTTMLFLSFAFFGLFGILTVVIKYLAIIVDLLFKKQKYNFKSIEKLTC